jgi:hypothetical protein
MLEEARSGKPIRRSISLPEPQDHTGDYDDIIAMLEFSVDNEIELPSMSFQER